MRLTFNALALLPVLLLLANSSSPVLDEHTGKKAEAALLTRPLTIATSNSEALYQSWNLGAAGLSKDAFDKAYKGYTYLESKNLLSKNNLLTIVDYSKPSSEKRLFILEMNSGRVLFNTLVAHGRNSGSNYAQDFSNAEASHKSSLGFYVTLNTYKGENGYSLKLRGCETGINDKASRRAIVIHGADYVSENFVRRNGFLGRSYGCPAIPMEWSKEIIDIIKGGSCMFLYYPSKKYLKRSRILNS